MISTPSTRRGLLTAGAALVLAGCAAGGGAADWSRHDPASRRSVDHRSWQLFLDRKTRTRDDGVTLVDYVAVSSAERELLDTYLSDLADVPVATLRRAEQLAFWLNLHNAAVVRLVLDHLIVRSPDEIELGGLLARGPWTTPLVRVEGRRLSLDAIRRQALAPVFRDPRWHYGLCDATRGAPSLPREAFSGNDVDRRLEDAAIDYVGHPRAVAYFMNRPGVVRLNALWRRNIEDFGGTLAGVLANIDLYGDEPLRAALAGAPEVEWMDDRILNALRV